MACVALTSLMATIELEFLQPIQRVFLPDKAPIESSIQKLFCFQTFLEKESSDGGVAIKDLEIEIRDFALQVEDEIEMLLSNFLMAKGTEYQEKATQELCQILLEGVENAAKLLKIINSINNEAYNEAIEDQPLKYASDDFEYVNSDESTLRLPKLHHKEFKEVMSLLLQTNEQRVIVVIGMLGIGKTTLAKAFFDNPSIVNHFYIRCWITIPQGYNESQMLSHILWSIAQAAAPTKIEKGSTFDELAFQVRLRLDKRYLIVLDNFWNHPAFDVIQQYLPHCHNGSRILIITRHLDPNFYARSTRSCCCLFKINMPFLDPEESWSLFHNVLSPKKLPKLEKIRSHVVEKCDGLPQLIVAVAERLAKCDNVKEGWEKIEKELESLGILDRSKLTESYNQLPQCLKVYFLYFGVFPKRSKISIKVLIRVCIAEGFVNPLEHEDLESQVYGYLKELINRSLVLICMTSLDGRLKTCRMHSALHTFCVGEAQKEGILCAVNTQQHLGLQLIGFANSCRWLSLYAHSFDYYVLFSTNNSRSIFFFDESPETSMPLKLLRVLAFVPSSFLQRVSIHFGDLIFLRYLSLTQWFEGLDCILSRMSNLRTLVVSSNEPQLGSPTCHLPSGIWDLSQLRHLELGNSYTVDPQGILVKENFLTLSWVTPTPWRKEVCYRFSNIKKLKIFVKDDLEPNDTRGSCSNPIILDNLNYLLRFEKLTISISIGCVVALPTLSMFPSQLKKLRLSGTNLLERDLTLIGTLPLLEVLKLENALAAKVWKVAKKGFNGLKALLLEDKYLEKLVASWDDFPMLDHLVIRSCYRLEEIPMKFAKMFMLRSIELVQCHPSLVIVSSRFKKSMVIIEEDLACLTINPLLL